MDRIKCADCDYCIGRESEYTMETLFFCEHPDQGYINSYFNTRRIIKIPGMIGAVRYRTDKAPFKSSPAWCPMKRKHDTVRAETSPDNDITSISERRGTT